ncbi:kelch-like protein 24 [Styela clava]
MESHVILEDKSLFSDVFKELDEFRKTQHDCDLLIKVGCKEFSVHRNILSASSGYFKDMLKDNTIANESGYIELKVDKVDVDSIKHCIDFIYGGNIIVSNEDRENLIHVAHQLQLQKLCNLIADTYLNKLQMSTFFFIKNLAKTYNCKTVEEKCDEFALENFTAISKIEEFNHLDSSYIAFLIGSAENKSLAQRKVKALISWTQFDLKERSKYFYSILESIDLSRLPLSYRKYLLKSIDLVSASIDCVRLLCESFLGNIEIAHESDDFEDNQDFSIALFDDNSRYIQIFNPRTGKCTQMHQLHNDMVSNSFTAVTMHDVIYVFTEKKFVYSLKYIDALASWRRLPDMFDSHGCWPPAVIVKNNIFVAGVSYPCRGSRSVEIYNPLKNIWTKSVNRKMPCINSSPVYSKGYLYCVGGNMDNQWRFKNVERLDISSMTWSNIPPMQEARSSPAVVIFQNNLYVLGGNEGSQRLVDVEYYNPDSNIWTELTSMLNPRWRFNAFSINENIYAVGDCEQNPSTLEKFNVTEGQWERVQLPYYFTNMRVIWSIRINSCELFTVQNCIIQD